MKKPTSKRVKARSKIPAHVKVPKFCSNKDIEKIIQLKQDRPKALWTDLINEVIEDKFN